MLKAGIVGLPNVGKSTLFNALTRSRKAEAANYPFCTIEPNVGVVVVPDALGVGAEPDAADWGIPLRREVQPNPGIPTKFFE